MKEFQPEITLEGNELLLNNETVETMNLDASDSKIMIMSIINPESKRKVNEMFIVKTNGSSFDKPEEVENIIPKDKVDKIRTVKITKGEDGELTGSIPATKELIETLKENFGSTSKSFKLIVCNIDNKIAKEFKEVFDINENFYRIVKMTDKRKSLGKEKESEIKNEKRVKL